MILWICACPRPGSRTLRLAEAYLQMRGEEYTKLDLTQESVSFLNGETLEERTKKTKAGAFDDPLFRYARQFAAADEIVFAAPFWDLSFPGVLKAYIENICSVGVTFRYGQDGVPVGLCRAKKMTFVTTAGGKLIPDYGYEQIRALCRNMFGIPESELIYAEKLDIVGFDAEQILQTRIAALRKSFPGA